MANYDIVAKRHDAMAHQDEATAQLVNSSVMLIGAIILSVLLVVGVSWALWGKQAAQYAFVIVGVLLLTEVVGHLRSKSNRDAMGAAIDSIIAYQAADDAGEVHRMKAQGEGFRAIQEMAKAKETIETAYTAESGGRFALAQQSNHAIVYKEEEL